MKHDWATIRINNLRLNAHHGVLAEERKLGGRYEADIEYKYDARKAAATDELAAAVDYGKVADCVQSAVTATRRKLIETVAHNVLTAVLHDFPRIGFVRLRLRKLNLPLAHALDYVEIEVSRYREGNDA